MKAAFIVEIERRQVIEEARRWVGTPYHHQASVMGHGVDCAMLPLSVYSSCGVIERFKVERYSSTFYLHRSDEIYLKYVKRHSQEVLFPEPGDFALFKLGRLWAHGAIVVSWPIVIHAVAAERLCLEDDLSHTVWFGRPVRFFSPWSP